MAAAKHTNVPEERLELHRALLAAVPGVAEKSGNLYSMIRKHGLVGLRLPPDERAAFLERYDAGLFRGDPARPPAKESVAVPDDLLERTDELAPYLERSDHYTLRLEPKATKRAGG